MYQRNRPQPQKSAPGGLREFSDIAFPLVVSNGSMTLMYFVDRLFLSWAGPAPIAASVPSGILALTLMSFFIGVSEYTNTFVAQLYGAERYRSIGLVVWQGIFFSLFAGLVSLFLLPLGNYLFDRSGHAPDVIALEKTYFTSLYSGAVFYVLNGALSSFYSGRGKTRIIMVVSIIANGINAVLDYGMIFGVWGFPRMGIRGAAVATVISMALMCLFYMIGFLSAENQRIFHTRRSIRIDTTGIKKLIRYGAPSGMQFFLDISAITVFVFLIGQLGKAELAASNIVWAINALAFYPMLGASVATATLVGQYIGRKDLGTAEKSTYTALKAVEAYMLFFAVLYYLFPHTLMEWFHGGSGAVEAPFAGIADLGSRILLFVAIYQISDAMTITFSGALRGAGDTAFAMWTGVICSWLLFVPGTWIALNRLGWGIMGAWLWATIYTTVMGVVYMLRFRSGYWKRIRLIDDDG